MPFRVLLLLVLLCSTLIYLPGLSGGFAFDDYSNILNNPAVAVDRLTADSLTAAIWSGNSGILKRPLSILSFAINFSLTGSFPMAFKITNLAIHLINGLLLFALSYRILSDGERALLPEPRARQVALLTTLLWLVHPLNLTSVLYVVQRMNSLSALFTFAALIAYCSGRSRQLRGSNGNLLLYVAAPAFGTIGALCKENALLVGLLCYVIECTVYRFGGAVDRDRRRLKVAYALVLLVPIALGTMYLVINPEWLASRYAFRPFTLPERLLTEARVIWWYLRMILVPQLGELGLYHDDFAISTGLLQPFTTLPAVAGTAGLAFAGVLARRKLPLLTFSIFWFLAGHLLESSVFSLELVHEHRNYLPGAGVLLFSVYGMDRMCARFTVRWRTAFPLAMAVLFAGLTGLRAAEWGDLMTLVTVEAERHPNSHRTVYELGRIQYGMYRMTGESHYLQSAIANIERSADLDATAKRPYFGLMRLANVEKIPLRDTWTTTLAGRLANTVIHPSEVSEFQVVNSCFKHPDCSYSPASVFRFFEAALSNPRLDDRRRAQVLVEFSVFNANAIGAIDTSITMAKDAIEIAPAVLSYRRVLMQFLVAEGRHAEVREVLADVAKRRVWRDAVLDAADIDHMYAEFDTQAKKSEANELP